MCGGRLQGRPSPFGVTPQARATPEPSQVSKSHGCVRLTNWDARELAAMVERGTPVLFLESSADAMASVPAR
jgi:L,D-transpeptidase catalytic domain